LFVEYRIDPVVARSVHLAPSRRATSAQHVNAGSYEAADIEPIAEGASAKGCRAYSHDKPYDDIQFTRLAERRA